MTIKSYRLQRVWLAVKARAPRLSTGLILVFAAVTLGPWYGYQTITLADRNEQLANAQHSLELLATLYGEYAIEAAQAAGTRSSFAGFSSSRSDVIDRDAEWMRIAPHAGNAKFSIRLMQPAKAAAGPSVATGRPDAVRSQHDHNAVTAEADFRAAGITAVASMSDADILGGWAVRTRFWTMVLFVRSLLAIGLGGFLVSQLRWREATQAELIRTREAAESATRAKSAFLANMSHELRTPLNAVIGFSEAIKLGMFGPLNSRYREYGGDIFNSGTHLLRLVNDLLDISKLEAGQFELDEAATDIAGVIGAAMRLVQPLARSANVKLRENIAAGLPLVRADARRLQQAILNLAANAVKFTPPGGEVRISAGQEDGRLMIRVTDTGVGMTKDQIPRALQPFRQLKNAFRTKYNGTGLGLPIAKDLVELHGGILKIESEVGVGTTVTISLPATRILCDLPQLRANSPATVAA